MGAASNHAHQRKPAVAHGTQGAQISRGRDGKVPVRRGLASAGGISPARVTRLLTTQVLVQRNSSVFCAVCHPATASCVVGAALRVSNEVSDASLPGLRASRANGGDAIA